MDHVITSGFTCWERQCRLVSLLTSSHHLSHVGLGPGKKLTTLKVEGEYVTTITINMLYIIHCLSSVLLVITRMFMELILP